RRRILLDDCVTVGMVVRRSSNGRLAAKLANTHTTLFLKPKQSRSGGSVDGPFRCHAGLCPGRGNGQFYQGGGNPAPKQDDRDTTGAATRGASARQVVEPHDTQGQRNPRRRGLLRTCVTPVGRHGGC